MLRIGALLGVSAALVLPLRGGSLDRPLPLRGPESATAALTALVPEVAGGRTVRLAQLDPTTLDALRTSRPLGPVQAWALSPDGRLLALGVDRTGTNATSLLRFASAGTLRLVRRGVRLDGALRAVLWPTAERLYAIVDDGTGSGLAVVTVNTVAKKVVASRRLAGTVDAVARSAGGLVLLLVRPNAIEPATVAVLRSDGSVRSVRVDRISAGVVWPQDEQKEPIGTTRRPGLAVDPAGTAYLLDAGGLVAAVDLDTLAVSYHSLASRSLLGRLDAWLTPAAQAKGLNGTSLAATWLGDGLLALAGTTFSAVRGNDGTFTFSSSPAGLAVVDTRDWTRRILDPRGWTAVVADGALLATGGSWTSDGTTSTETEDGLSAYGADGTLRWRLFDGRSAWVAGVLGGTALVQVGSKLELVDVAAGRVRAELDGAVPQLLVGAGS